MKTRYFALAALALPLAAMAQTTVSVDFEDPSGYKALGVYDTWEESPFRTGKLQGNVAVVDNFLPQTNADGVVLNDSKKILGVQRSRFGSNTFGARVDLNEPLSTTPTTIYVHVKMYKPCKGKAMLVGLGKRPDRAGQSNDVEQFWVYSSKSLPENEWCDAVFPIKTCDGVDIHSFVIVPDPTTPNHLTDDFAAYFDDILVNNDNRPRIKQNSFYELNFDETTVSNKSGNYVRSIKLVTTSNGTQTRNVGQKSPQLIYNDLTNYSFRAKAGDTVTPTISFTGNWMNGYVYLDRDNDGQFNVKLNDNYTNAEGSDLMSYYYIETVEDKKGYKYDGTEVSGDARNTMETPAFKLPADLPVGFYRMRFKVDWGNTDPAGRMTATNNIKQNGGAVIDTRINIHADKVSVSAASRNGFITDGNGGELVNYETNFGKPLAIIAKPAPGFAIDSVTIYHGYNLNGEQYNKYGTKQWDKVVIRANVFNKTTGKYTLPASLIDGDIMIDAQFASTTAVKQAKKEEPLTFTAAAGKLLLKASQPTDVVVADADGRILFKQHLTGSHALTLPTGIYVVNGQKVTL